MKKKIQSVAWLMTGLMLTPMILPVEAFAENKQAIKKSPVVKGKESKGFSEQIKKKREELLKLDKDILSLESEIKDLNKALKKEDELILKKQELKEKEELLKERWKGYSARMATWQVEGTPDVQFIEVLFGSDSISDMISRAYTFQTLMTAEQEQIQNLKDKTEELLQEKNVLEEEIEKMKKQKKEALSKQKELDDKKVKMEKELDKLQKDELARIQKEMKEQEERKKKLLAEQMTNTKFDELRSLTKELGAETNSHFIRPAQGRLTSPYGVRPNPFGGSGTEFHTGIDIANPTGTPIVATAGGDVIKVVQSNAGYGNYVVLKHTINGEVFHSLYAHLSMNGVKVGESVKQGEVVGLMGSTGRSTGPHLHFEIQDANQEHLNPSLLLDKGEKKADKKDEKKNGDEKEKMSKQKSG